MDTLVLVQVGYTDLLLVELIPGLRGAGRIVQSVCYSEAIPPETDCPLHSQTVGQP
jgi:hypothetical protein